MMTFLIFTQKSFGNWEHLVAIILAFACSGLVFYFTKDSEDPPSTKFFWILELSSFVMSLTWVYMLAGVIVDILTTYELMSGISAAFLGLTVLSWGNSVGDAFATIAISKRGYGEMAFTGCIAGPVFNLMLGLGLTCIRVNLKVPAGIPFSAKKLDEKTRLTILTLISTIVVIIALMGMAITNKFEMNKWHGRVLICMYCAIVALIMFFSVV